MRAARPDAVFLVADPAPLARFPDLLARAPRAAGLPGDEPFALLLCVDRTEQDDDALATIADVVVRRGAFAVSTWGEGCEWVHDLVDETVVALEVDEPGAAPPGTLMTTWHSGETLADALQHFVTLSSASPDRAGGRLWVVLRDDVADTGDTVGWFVSQGLPHSRLVGSRQSR